MTPKEKRIVFLSACGQVVEYYDFTVFVLLANVISSAFFEGALYSKYIYIFGVFALGYFVRPLGGMIFGHYGDTIGRKKTFIVTILLTSMATFCVGLVPDYKTIGLFAPIILVFLRIIQGFALGGESPGAISFVEENMSDKDKTFGISFIPSAVCFGYLLASLVATILYSFFSNSEIFGYGWRAAFFLGGILGFIVCMLRGKMLDTPVFENLLKTNQILRYPLGELIKRNTKNCILGILIMISTVYGTIFMFTLPPLLSSYLHFYPHEYILKVNTFAIIILSICTTLFGYIIDRLKLNIFLFYSIMCFLIVLIIFPLFIMIHTQSNFYLILAYVIFAISISLIGGAAYHAIAKLFPATVKYSGLGMTINIATIFGIGMPPLLSTLLLKSTGSLYYLAYALMAFTIIPGIAGLILFFRPPNQDKLNELDKIIKELYILGKKSKIEPLSPEEEILFMQKLEQFAETLIENGLFFESYKTSVNSPITLIENEMHKLNIRNISNLDYEQQQALYQNCKSLLKTRANDPKSIIHKYQERLEDSMSNKYFTYFYSKLIAKAYMTADQHMHLTMSNIDSIVIQREKDIDFFGTYE